MLSVKDRFSKWISLWRLLPSAGVPLAVAAAVGNVVVGFLPMAFVVAVSSLLDGIATGDGEHRWQDHAAAFVVVSAAFLLHQLLVPLPAALGEIVARRVDGRCVQDLMRTTLTEAAVEQLENPRTMDVLSDARAAYTRAALTPGDAVAGVLALLARYTQLGCAVALVSLALHPLAGAVAGLTALVIRFGQRGSLARFSGLMKSLASERRSLIYVRALVSGPGLAKEARVFGLRPWLRELLERDTEHYVRPLWKGRRALLFWPFVRYSLVGLLGGAVVLAMLSFAHDGLSVLQLTVALQATVVLIRFGVYFPESDVPTAYGMNSYTALGEFKEIAGSTSLRTGAPAAPPEGELSFRDVSFRYSPDSPDILRGLDLDLVVGGSTAIVGLNGAGKTTLVKLLARLYEPTGGRIVVDGRDLAQVDARDWQRQVAVVFQDYNRYQFSAADNIGMGAPAHLDDVAALERAAAQAGADTVIDHLPDGARTVLSRDYAGGRELSGGQWQRIALARAYFAIAKGASVLVLDEPTAQLDVRAEAEFFDRFLATTAAVTSVVISHRFSTVRRADRIVVLEHGRVVESGSHDELVALGGRYADMFTLQAQRFQDDATKEAR